MHVVGVEPLCLYPILPIRRSSQTSDQTPLFGHPSGFSPLRAWYPVKLLLFPASIIHAGIGGVMLRSISLSLLAGFRVSSISESASRSRSSSTMPRRRLSSEMGEMSGDAGAEPERSRVRERIEARSEMTVPAPGAAVTMVPGVAVGANGESVRKSGWICDSGESSSGVVVRDRVGLTVLLKPLGAEGEKLRLRFRCCIELCAVLGCILSSGPGDGLREVVGEAGMVSKNLGGVGCREVGCEGNVS